jgi:pimeloyl-ACP methyl ester carboxylesterase
MQPLKFNPRCVSGGVIFWRSLLLVALFCTECGLGFQPTVPFQESFRWIRLAASSSSTSITRSKGNVQIHEDYVSLPNGITMQVLVSMPPSLQNNKNPNIVLFLHGSFHAAWCWEEHYMPFFSQAGFITVAPSWRGTGGTPCIVPEQKIPIHEHVEDFHHLWHGIPAIVQSHVPKDGVKSWRINNETPVHVVCHSFGGIVLMKYLEQYFDSVEGSPPTFRSIATMCAVPPSGNGRMTMRYLRRSLRDSWKITRGFAMKQCCNDALLCRELFFTMPTENENEDATNAKSLNGISDEELTRYQSNFFRDSRVVIDLLDLAKKLPSEQTTPQGEARFVAQRPSAFPPCLVVGAQHDFLVDSEGLYETAQYFGCYENGDDRLFHVRSGGYEDRVPKVVLVDSPHDVMLGATWINGAELLLRWLEENA